MKNKLRNKKGITLIALVITIIVLLILAGVSITMISSQDGILGKATNAKETQKEATEVEKVKLAVQAAMMNENGTVDKTELNNELSKIGYGPVSDLPADIEINGEKYTITSNGEVELKTLKVGDEVTYQGENFYVIGFSADKTKVNLLAKYNLKADGSSQDTTGANNPCAFSSTNYWSSEKSYPLDLNNYTIPEGATSIVTTAKAYGTKLGTTGRLMTVEEVVTLGGSKSDYSTSGCKAYINSQNFWLGSADYRSLWFVYGGERHLEHHRLQRRRILWGSSSFRSLNIFNPISGLMHKNMKDFKQERYFIYVLLLFFCYKLFEKSCLNILNIVK